MLCAHILSQCKNFFKFSLYCKEKFTEYLDDWMSPPHVGQTVTDVPRYQIVFELHTAALHIVKNKAVVQTGKNCINSSMHQEHQIKCYKTPSVCQMASLLVDLCMHAILEILGIDLK